MKKIPTTAPCPTCGAPRKAVAGSDLNRVRRLAKLTLQDVSDRTGYSKGYLSDVENGRRLPTAAIVAAYEGFR